MITPINKICISFVDFFSAGMGIFLIFAGNYMSKVETNFFEGIRVPWTLASGRDWRATHLFSARLMVTVGLMLLLLPLIYRSMGIAVALTLVAFLLQRDRPLHQMGLD